MPLYDVKCKKCGAEFEARLSEFDSPMPKCFHSGVECGGELEKQLSKPSGFVFKGEGTYDKGYVSK